MPNSMPLGELTLININSRESNTFLRVNCKWSGIVSTNGLNPNITNYASVDDFPRKAVLGGELEIEITHYFDLGDGNYYLYNVIVGQ